MILQEQLNFSRQITKQDKELSQFINYLEKQQGFFEKNIQKESRLKERLDKIEGEKRNKQLVTKEKAELKQIELSLIKQNYEKNQHTKSQNLAQRLTDQEERHQQIIQEQNLIRQDKSMIQNLSIQETVQRAQQLAQEKMIKKKREYQQQLEYKQKHLEQLLGEKSQKRIEKSFLYQLREKSNLQTKEIGEQLNLEKMENNKQKYIYKDTLSLQVQAENQKLRQFKLFEEKAKIERGLEEAKKAEDEFKKKLQIRQSQTEYKMQKLDQMMREKKLIQEQEKERQAQILREKLHLKSNFEKMMSKLDKQRIL